METCYVTSKGKNEIARPRFRLKTTHLLHLSSAMALLFEFCNLRNQRQRVKRVKKG